MSDQLIAGTSTWKHT